MRRSRGLGDVYKRQLPTPPTPSPPIQTLTRLPYARLPHQGLPLVSNANDSRLHCVVRKRRMHHLRDT
jgi:hypothetical protein